MLKRICAAVCAAVSALTLTACTLTARDKYEVRHDIAVPPKMLFLGDSIAAGYGLDGYSKDDLYSCRSYANILGDKYEKELANECGHTMVNKAVSGATSSGLLKLVSSGNLDADLADCDAVVVSIGGNDLLGLVFDLFGRLGYSPESGSFNYKNFDLFSAADALTELDSQADEALAGFETNLPEIVKALSSRTQGKLYIQTLYDPLEYYAKVPKVPEFSKEKIGRLNDIIKNGATGSYTVIDVAAVFEGQAETLTNIKDFDIHPNFIGHQIIADEVDAAFRSTGFSYTTEEYTDEHLTREGYAAVIGGIVLGIAALIIPAYLVGRTVKRREK